MTKPHPMLGKNEWSGFARVNQTRRERKAAAVHRCMMLTFGGATAETIARELGVSVSTVYDYKAELRAAGKLGCCMADGCRHLTGGQTHEQCKWYVK